VEIRVSPRARKQLRRLPTYIGLKFEYWCDLIRSVGMREARKYKGYHDEPLAGKRTSQRSVRLSKHYRVINVEMSEGKFEVIKVIEVNKHEY
jgi:proteic killer suppression protein